MILNPSKNIDVPIKIENFILIYNHKFYYHKFNF